MNGNSSMNGVAHSDKKCLILLLKRFFIENHFVNIDFGYNQVHFSNYGEVITDAISTDNQQVSLSV